MQQIDFYLDFVSPYSFLAFERLPDALQGLSYQVRYRPLLLGALLRHHGNSGPAAAPGPKRDWTYRHALWLAHAQGTAMQLPAAHPFDPLPLLRLALACSNAGQGGGGDGSTNREVTGALLRHVWQAAGADAADAADPRRLAALVVALQPARDAADPAVKALLRAQTDAAIARGVFGVPTFVLGPRVFWGVDALPMLRACLEGDPWFEENGAWDAASKLPSALPG